MVWSAFVQKEHLPTKRSLVSNAEELLRSPKVRSETEGTEPQLPFSLKGSFPARMSQYPERGGNNSTCVRLDSRKCVQTQLFLQTPEVSAKTGFLGQQNPGSENSGAKYQNPLIIAPSELISTLEYSMNGPPTVFAGP